MKRWSGPSRVKAAHETGSFSFEAGWTGRVALWANSTVPVLASTAIADVRPRGTDGARSELVSRETRSPGAASGAETAVAATATQQSASRKRTAVNRRR